MPPTPKTRDSKAWEPQQVLCPSHCETAAWKIPKRCFWNPLKTKKSCPSLQATRQNPRKRCLGSACEKAEPQQVLCPSHCETAAWKIPKRCFWNPLKTKKSCPSLQAVWQNPRKRCLGSACEKAEPQQVLCPSHCETAAWKIPKRCFWNPLKTKKKSCLEQGKPFRNVRLGSLQATKQNPRKTQKKGSLDQGKLLRNVRLGSLQATRRNPRKRCLGSACEKAEPQQVLCPSHCETAAWKIPKRCFWNPLKTKKSCPSLQATRQNPRKRCLGSACEKAEPQQVLCPSHCETAAWKIPKRCFWNPLKTKKSCPSLQAVWQNPRKRCLGSACEKAEPQQVLCPSHCETAAWKIPKRCFWNPPWRSD